MNRDRQYRLVEAPEMIARERERKRENKMIFLLDALTKSLNAASSADDAHHTNTQRHKHTHKHMMDRQVDTCSHNNIYIEIIPDENRKTEEKTRGR